MWKRGRVMAAAVVWSLGVGLAPAQADEVVLEWNQITAATTLSASPALAPVQQTRVMAIVQVAVHDAVNGVTGTYRPIATRVRRRRARAPRQRRLPRRTPR